MRGLQITKRPSRTETTGLIGLREKTRRKLASRTGRSFWFRHGLERFKKGFALLEEKEAKEDIIYTVAQLVTWRLPNATEV